jgi:hypothetical protein
VVCGKRFYVGNWWEIITMRKQKDFLSLVNAGLFVSISYVEARHGSAFAGLLKRYFNA